MLSLKCTILTSWSLAAHFYCSPSRVFPQSLKSHKIWWVEGFLVCVSPNNLCHTWVATSWLHWTCWFGGPRTKNRFWAHLSWNAQLHPRGTQDLFCEEDKQAIGTPISNGALFRRPPLYEQDQGRLRYRLVLDCSCFEWTKEAWSFWWCMGQGCPTGKSMVC